MTRKGFIFTLDALLAIVLVSIVVMGIIASQESAQSVYKTYMRSQTSKTANDVLMILRTVPLNQLVPEDVIEDWIREGILNTTLVSPDMAPIDIAATYWAVTPKYGDKFKENTAKILGYILNATLEDYSYELLINNWTSPFMTKGTETYEQADDVSASTLTLSGYEYNKTPSGFIARLYLAQITKQDEYIYMSDAVLSYPYYVESFHFWSILPGIGGKYLPIFKQDNTVLRETFNLPFGRKVASTLFFMPSRYIEFNWDVFGGLIRIESIPATVTATINNEVLRCNGNVYNEYQLGANERYIKIYDPKVDDPDNCNLLEYLYPEKQNTLEYVVQPYQLKFSLFWDIISWDTKTPWLAIGDSGSSHLIYVYNTTKFKTYEFVHDFNFPDVETENPTQVEKAIFIPHNITGMNVRVHINVPSTTTNVTLRLHVLDKVINVSTRTVSGEANLTWSDVEIRNALNSAGLAYDDLANQYFYVILNIGLKDYEEVVSPYEYGILYDDEPTFLAEKFPHIEGGFHLIGEDSIVHVDYETPSYSIHTISLTRSPEVSYYSGDSGDGEFYSHIEWVWNLPNVTPLYTKFLFPYFWNKLENSDPHQLVSLKNDAIGEKILYCHGDSCNPNRGLLKVFNRWGYGIWARANDGSTVSPTMAPGENKFILDFNDGFYVSKDNSIGETLILLDSYVPYGNVFPYLLQGYPKYTGYNLTYYYQDISGTVRSDNLLIGVAYVTNVTYLSVDIDDIVNNETYKKCALDDAIIRLFQKLGGVEKEGHHLVIPIKLDSTVSDVVPLQRVPSLYTPIQVTLRIWREG